MDPNDPMRAALTLMGEVVATKQLLAVLIASHPDRELLRDMWHQSKPEWIDEQSESALFRFDDYKKGFLEAMTWMTGVIDAQ